MKLWTSEAVSSGHPDKVADQIADTILDLYLAADPQARVAAEVTVINDLLLLTGEINSSVTIGEDVIEDAVRKTIIEIGYDSEKVGFDGRTVPILNKLRKQSHQISAAVAQDNGVIGAGDQGMMFGFACNETPAYMPLAHNLSFQLIEALEQNRKAVRPYGIGESILLPDAKTQVTVEYNDAGMPIRIHTVVLSTCHKDGITRGDLNGYVGKFILDNFRDANAKLVDKNTIFYINPAGLWTFGGPAADTGLSGRKIVVDQYGADCPIGGGSFSGKDPTKVDRSAAYMARYLAKNIVAACGVQKVMVQLAYAIGVSEPVSVWIQSDLGLEVTEKIRHLVDLTPKGIIDRLDLRKPIYKATASGGHFGREGFSWEKLDLVELIRKTAK